MIISDDGTMIRTGAETVSVLKRATQGVRLMKVSEGARVISITTTDKEANGDEEENKATEENTETDDVISEETESTTEE
jgi:DNA gyrase subunit A